MKKEYLESFKKIVRNTGFYIGVICVLISFFAFFLSSLKQKERDREEELTQMAAAKEELAHKLLLLEEKTAALTDLVKEKDSQLREFRELPPGNYGATKIKPVVSEANADVKSGDNASGPSGTHGENESSDERPASLQYVMGIDDVLAVSVWECPEWNTDVVVGPDGTISFPLIGNIKTAGMTLHDLKRELTRRLSEYVRQPIISLSLRKLGGRKVIVLGEVNNPGVYGVTGAKTILEAIALAGGFTHDAVTNSVVVIRGGFDKPKAKRFNLNRVFKGDIKQNVALQSEDIVFVPKTFISNVDYFLSQVLDPLSKGMYSAREIQYWTK